MNLLNQVFSSFKQKSSRGFTIIFAVIIGSLLVALGVAITDLALKQLAISALSRESQSAFYAADGGIECALYWDLHGPYLANTFYFASPLPGRSDITVEDQSQIKCGKSVESLSWSRIDGGGVVSSYYLNRFIIRYGVESPCAVVTIKKYDDGIGTNVVDSHGINDCSNTENKYRVERSLRAEYR